MLKPLIEANDGRCFMLCTSHAMMRDLAEQFRATMTLPVLLREKPARSAFAAVRQRRECAAGGDQQLLGKVDVRGDALSLVIIDKLPFTSPDDPLLQSADGGLSPARRRSF